MMDHGFFDGPWRGGMSSGGGSLRLLREIAKQKRKEREAAQGIEAPSGVETTQIGSTVGESPVAEGHAPKDSRQGSSGEQSI